jgi:proton glutamate symport protein
MTTKTAKPISEREKITDSSTDLMLGSKLWLYIIIGMITGIGLGLILSPSGFALVPNEIATLLAPWLALPGIIFIGLLKMVIVPLVLCSIILGLATAGSLDHLKQMGFRLLPYFILTTMIAITIGISMAQLIKPGTMIDPQIIVHTVQSSKATAENAPQTLSELTIPDRIANLIPTNPAKAQVDRNLLQIVVLAIFLGICVVTIPSTITKPFEDLCLFGQTAAMKIISWAMMIAPIAVFGLLSDITIKIGFNIIGSVAAYFFTVLGSLFLMLLVYLFIIKFIAGRSPFAFLKSIKDVQLLAFSTSSSAAVMPLSIQAAEEKLKIEPEISRFVVPIGATINMDGTALYQAAAAIFLCQVFGIDLSLGETILLLVTTVGASIGTPAMPGVGIVVLATILSGIGVPLSGIALILGVDRILDMCRTTINVTGDLTATTVMQKWVGKTTSKRKHLKH